MHNCMICRFQSDLQVPISLFDDGLQMTFSCNNCPYTDVYGARQRVGEMIYDMIKDRVWADGSVEVPDYGCLNFERRPGVSGSVY